MGVTIYQGYKVFVEMGNHPEINAFYAKKALKPILGNDSFIENVLQQKNDKVAHQLAKNMAILPTIDTIIATVSAVFNQSIKSILHSSRGRGSKNLARWVAMVVSQNVSGQALSTLAKAFHITHISGLHQAKKKLEKELENEQSLCKQLKLVYQKLTPYSRSL